VQVQPTAGPKWAFGKVLRESRQSREMSQEQLAEAAGLDRSFLSMVERGIQSPNIVVLLKLAEVLHVPAAEMIAKTEGAIRGRGRMDRYHQADGSARKLVFVYPLCRHVQQRLREAQPPCFCQAEAKADWA
jgi:transcriptional regulator with XRE-family HTH domain